MFDRTKERACKSCEKCSWCWEEDFVHTYQMGYEVLSAIDHYGSELNTETKRKLQQRLSAVGSVFTGDAGCISRCKTEYDVE